MTILQNIWSIYSSSMKLKKFSEFNEKVDPFLILKVFSFHAKKSASYLYLQKYSNIYK